MTTHLPSPATAVLEPNTYFYRPLGGASPPSTDRELSCHRRSGRNCGNSRHSKRTKANADLALDNYSGAGKSSRVDVAGKRLRKTASSRWTVTVDVGAREFPVEIEGGRLKIQLLSPTQLDDPAEVEERHEDRRSPGCKRRGHITVVTSSTCGATALPAFADTVRHPMPGPSGLRLRRKYSDKYRGPRFAYFLDPAGSLGWPSCTEMPFPVNLDPFVFIAHKNITGTI
ncbi:hypothetical protein DFH09DRAFT_1099832 [Mycena vulgaris]|nr:hypothetical protein DFH09DRAFT_1099832 [Mycena vulgaris]